MADGLRHLDRRGYPPPISGACGTDADRSFYRPRRLHRTKRLRAATPSGAVYVGRPTIWGNPFRGRPRIGHARSVILYRAWLTGNLTPKILASAGFGRDEIIALDRLRHRVLHEIGRLTGRNLQCWCPLTSPWCHADVLLDLANG